MLHGELEYRKRNSERAFDIRVDSPLEEASGGSASATIRLPDHQWSGKCGTLLIELVINPRQTGDTGLIGRFVRPVEKGSGEIIYTLVIT